MYGKDPACYVVKTSRGERIEWKRHGDGELETMPKEEDFPLILEAWGKDICEHVVNKNASTAERFGVSQYKV